MSYIQTTLTKSFEEWANAVGGVFPKISIVQFSDKWGIGGLSLQQIEEGEDLVVVPLNIVINHFTALNTEPFKGVSSLLEQLDPLWVTYLFIIHEKNNPFSFWKPYFDILPNHFSTPLYWPKHILEEINGTNLYDQTNKIVHSLREIFEKVLPTLVEKAPTVFKPEIFTLDSFLWAFSVFWSRCFAITVNGSLVASLTPIADSLNHNPSCKVQYLTDEKNGLFHFVNLTKQQAGQQTFVDYKTPSQTNEKLLLHYGFMIETDQNANSEKKSFKRKFENDSDTVEIVDKKNEDQDLREYDSCWVQLQIMSNDPLQREKREIISKLGLDFRQDLTRSGLPLSLISLSRISLLNSEEFLFFNTQDNMQHHPITPRNELLVFSTLQNLLQEKLNKISQHNPTNSDIESLKKIDYFRYLALTYKKSQQEILAISIDKVRDSFNQYWKSVVHLQVISTPYFYPLLFQSPQLSNYLKWIESSLQIDDIDVSSKDIFSGDIIQTIPLSCVISMNSDILTSELGTVFKQIWDERLSQLLHKFYSSFEEILMHLYIVNEHKNPLSRFAPFFQVLFSSADHMFWKNSCLFWSESELEELGDSKIANDTKELRDSLKEDFDILSPFLLKHSSVFASEIFNFENYLMAFVIFENLGFSGNLVPLYPPRTHHPYVLRNQHLDLDTKCFTIKTITPILRGEKIFCDFGPLPNSQLLLIYGQILPNNPFDTVSFELSLLESDPAYKYKIKLQEKFDIPLDFQIKMDSCLQELPPTILKTIKLVTLSKKDAIKYLKEIRDVKNSGQKNDDLQKVEVLFQGKMDSNSVDFLSSMFLSALKSLELSEEDKVHLNSNNSDKKRLAIMYKSEQQKIIKNNLELLKKFSGEDEK